MTTPSSTTVVDDPRNVTISSQNEPSGAKHLWMEIYIEGDDFEKHAFSTMFLKAKCRMAKTPETADLVVFTGGVDVDPALYGEEKHWKTETPDHKRDARDMELYAKCFELGIPMFGVCRGAQFLHVMNGGKLYQHVNNHVGDHEMWALKSGNVKGYERIMVSSVHHQMCIKNEEMVLLGDSSKATERWINNKDKVEGSKLDVEAYFYPDTCCLGVQGHPEYSGYDQFLEWCIDQMDKFIFSSPETELRGRYRRLKQSVMDGRNVKLLSKDA